MIALTLLLLGFLWGYVGQSAPRYFYDRDHGETPPLKVLIICALAGPFAWVIGWHISVTEDDDW